jgi:hypothetical protein
MACPVMIPTWWQTSIPSQTGRAAVVKSEEAFPRRTLPLGGSCSFVCFAERLVATAEGSKTFVVQR